MLLDVKKVAQHLGSSVHRVWELARTDATFPRPVKLGRLTRWRLAEIDEWSAKLPRIAFGEQANVPAPNRKEPQ